MHGDGMRMGWDGDRKLSPCSSLIATDLRFFISRCCPENIVVDFVHSATFIYIQNYLHDCTTEFPRAQNCY